jgi:hypothetical protein
MTLRLRGRNVRPMKTTSAPFQRDVASVQNIGVNDDRDTWTCMWGETVKATARALCAK